MKKNKLILRKVVGALIAFSFLAVIFVNQNIAYAVIGTDKIENPLGTTTTLTQVLAIVIATAQVIAGVLSVVFIILAGLKFVLANGDPAKIKTAQTMLLYVVIGVAIIFGAQAISTVVQNTIMQVGSGQ